MNDIELTMNDIELTMNDIELTMNDIELIDEIVRRADEHQKQKEKAFAIAEIKKLKEEVRDVISTCFLDEDIYAILNVIDDYISKLKGEDNEIL